MTRPGCPFRSASCNAVDSRLVQELPVNEECLIVNTSKVCVEMNAEIIVGNLNAISTLCLEPGKVCVYEENTETNKALEQAGIELVPISIFELTNGFGGPNCLCLPLVRAS